jgi:hypothetical protein
MKRFPKDCDAKCPHYSCYDLNIDDLVSNCSLLNVQCDDCDMDFSYVICPLEAKEVEG